MSPSRLRVSLVVVAALALLGVHSLAAEEVRTWSDKSGKFKIEAEFVEILEGKVKLKRADGKVIEVPLASLSRDDQQYLRELMRKRREGAAGGGAEDADAAGGIGRRRGFPGRDEAPRWAVGDRVQYKDGFDYVAATVVEVDDHNVTIHFDGAPEGETRRAPPDWVEPLSDAVKAAAAWSWNPPTMKASLQPDYSSVRRPGFNPAAAATITPDPAPMVTAPPATATPATATLPLGAAVLGSRFASHEKLAAFDVATVGAPVVVAAYAGGREFRDVSTRIQVVDLATSQTRGSFSGPAKVTSIALSPTGKRLITRSEPEDFRAAQFLDLWDVTDKGLVHVASWQPYGTSPEGDREIDAVQWVDDARVLTSGGDDKLVLWQIEGAKAIVEWKAGNSFTLTPGGKQLACVSPDGVDVYALDSGEHVARLKTIVGGGAVAFSPSGRQLAVTGHLGAEVLDVTGAAPSRQFYINFGGGLSWLDEQFLLAGDGTVIDAAKQIVAWRYKRSGEGWLKGGRFWYLTGDDSEGNTVMNVVLPHPAARQATAAVNVQDVLAVAPGMAITLDVDLGDATATPEGLAQLTRAVEAAGLRVESGAAITLTARTRGGESQEMMYRRMFGGGRDEVTMSVPTRYYDVELLVGSVKAWATSNFQGPPHMPSLEEGESIQQAVSRHMGVSARFLPAIVPRNIVKAEYQKPRGESQLTERGIE
jgi:hypothetical protein